MDYPQANASGTARIPRQRVGDMRSYPMPYLRARDYDTPTDVGYLEKKITRRASFCNLPIHINVNNWLFLLVLIAAGFRYGALLIIIG